MQKQKNIFVGLVVATVLVVISACSPEKKSPLPDAPNILLIIADDLTWSDYGFMGHPIVKTPHIDQLAAEGVVFRNGYVANSLCRPSLATIATGLYPYQHGITANLKKISGPPNESMVVYPKRMSQLQTLPRFLSQLGYRTYQSGKWWEEGFETGGFDDGDKKPKGLFGKLERHNNIGRTGLQPIFDFIEEDLSQPFFIWYAPMMPHAPHNASELYTAPYKGKTDENELVQYWAMTTWFDQTVGDLMAYLEENKLQENTVIIYLTDNGELVKGDFMGREVRRSKNSPYDAGARTPYIFHWPSRWQAGERQSLVNSIDVFPTLVDLLGKQVDGLPGVSVLPSVVGDEELEREYVAGEGFITKKEGDFLNNRRSYRWIRSGKWKLIEKSPGRKPELYDLEIDPAELTNIAEENNGVVEDLLGKMNKELPVKPPKISL